MQIVVMEEGEKEPARALPVPTSTPRKTERRGTSRGTAVAISTENRSRCGDESSSGVESDHALPPPAIIFSILSSLSISLTTLIFFSLP